MTAFVAGLLAIRAGRRGSVVDDHPLCRKCGFDLSGRPDSSDRCPECGAIIAGPADLVIGHRVRRTRLIAIGTALVTLGPIVMLTAGLSLGTRLDWQNVKPTWWLMRESYSSTRSTRDAALNTLAARAAMDSLDAEQERVFINRVLTVQANAATSWSAQWADLVSQKIEAGTLPPEQRDAFLKTYVSVAQLSTRPDICVGDPLPMELSLSGARGPQSTRLSLGFDDGDGKIFVDGVEVTGPRGGSSRSSLSNNSMSAWGWIDRQSLERLSPGPHTLERRVLARLDDGFDAKADITTIPISATTTFTLHPRGTPLLKWIEDESLRPAVEAALKESKLEVRSGSAHLTVDASHAPLPMPVSFKMTIRQGDRTWPAGTFAAKSQVEARYGIRVEGIQLGTADLIFTPDEAGAASTIGIDTAWKGEVVIRGIPVTAMPP